MSAIKTRKSKSKKVREWSFLNQHIIYCKYFQRQKIADKIYIIIDFLKLFIFILFFERFLFKQYLKLFKIRKNIKTY